MTTKYVLIASNNQVIHWDLTQEQAEAWMFRYINIYPEENGKMHIEKQCW